MGVHGRRKFSTIWTVQMLVIFHYSIKVLQQKKCISLQPIPQNMTKWFLPYERCTNGSAIFCGTKARILSRGVWTAQPTRVTELSGCFSILPGMWQASPRGLTNCISIWRPSLIISGLGIEAFISLLLKGTKPGPQKTFWHQNLLESLGIRSLTSTSFWALRKRPWGINYSPLKSNHHLREGFCEGKKNSMITMVIPVTASETNLPKSSRNTSKKHEPVQSLWEQGFTKEDYKFPLGLNNSGCSQFFLIPIKLWTP